MTATRVEDNGIVKTRVDTTGFRVAATGDGRVQLLIGEEERPGFLKCVFDPRAAVLLAMELVETAEPLILPEAEPCGTA